MTSPLAGITVNLNVTTPLQPGDRVIVSLPDPPDSQHQEFFDAIVAEIRDKWQDVDFLFIAGGKVVVATGAAGTGISLGRVGAALSQG